MKHVPMIAKLAYLLAHLLALAGCDSTVDASPVDDHQVSFKLGLADYDLKSYQPRLPDDFNKPSPGTNPPDTTVEANTQPQPLPVVLGYSPKWCSVCPTAKAALKDNKDVDVQWENDESKFPQFIKDRGIYPAFYWQVGTGQWRANRGWHGLPWFIKQWKESFGRSSTRANPKTVAGDGTNLPSSADKAPAAVLHYHGQSSSWTWPGNLRSHLVTDHGYSAIQVAGMSDRQVIAAHDAAHNGTTMRAQAPRVRHRARACPSGGCPL